MQAQGYRRFLTPETGVVVLQVVVGKCSQDAQIRLVQGHPERKKEKEKRREERREEKRREEKRREEKRREEKRREEKREREKRREEKRREIASKVMQAVRKWKPYILVQIIQYHI
ncbi:hypothetical protein DUI87_27955 [Hirundo rustica rustica]|uniref:Uncharacterized protein n=1 Tax=Hirundo rustica rustica TaxID=333673 RepID=A0A3M0J334_HIRRU|nr:hypothetical protein DUI87_27955 [Hirundo rustica rustica]